MASPFDPVRGRVESALRAFFDARAEGLAEVGPELTPLLEHARAFVLAGGKRIRPTFAYWGWRASAPTTPDDALLTAAASLELLHGCALVHDDLMDGSATRRGKPAIHVAFAELHRVNNWPGDAQVFGNSAAVLLGDLLLNWADTMFAAAQLPDPARAVYDRMREQVLAGQYLDVLTQARGGFDPHDAVRVMAYKTSKYTVEGPLLLGAAAASASSEVCAALSDYGMSVGEAFQLRDDLLGVFGDPSATGKPAGDDLREGKHTLLVAWAMERATPEQADALQAGLGNRGLDDDGVDELRELIKDTGAVRRVEERIAACTEQAVAALANAAVAPDAARALAELALAAAQRQT